MTGSEDWGRRLGVVSGPLLLRALQNARPCIEQVVKDVSYQLNEFPFTSILRGADDGLDGPALPVLPAPHLAPCAPLHRNGDRTGAAAWRRAAPSAISTVRSIRWHCSWAAAIPAMLAHGARLGAQWGYDEINLNCGCPSERVQTGSFGACLMRDPQQVADCVKAMCDAVTIPVTVKHRIGLDSGEDYGFVRDFVGTVAQAGCSVFIVHARNALAFGPVAEGGKPRSAAVALRRRAPVEARFPRPDNRAERRAHHLAGDRAGAWIVSTA